MQAIAAAWEADAAEEASEVEVRAIPLGLHGDAVPFAHAVPKAAMAAATVKAAELVSKAAAAAPRGAKVATVQDEPKSTGKRRRMREGGPTTPQTMATSHDVPSTPQPTIDASGYPIFGYETPPPKASSSSPLAQDSADVHCVRATSRQRSVAAKANATAVVVNAVGDPGGDLKKKKGATASRGRAVAPEEQDTEIAQTLLVSGCRRCRC